MKPRKLLNNFIFFLPLGRLLELHYYPFGLDATPSGLGLSVSGKCQMGEVLAKRHSDAQVNKRSIQHWGCTVIMTYLVLGMCVIYIILVSLPYWAGLVECITLRNVLLNS